MRVLAASMCGFLAVLGSACTDYAFTPDDAISGSPNPPDLEVPIVSDRIVQSPEQLVDVLFVIDDSCSMGDYQEALGANMSAFMQFFQDSGLDYHIGVVSTDARPSSGGKLVDNPSGGRFITPQTADAVSAFSQMSDLGTSGDANERGLAATYAALETERDAHNVGFLRSEATLSVIIVSDEDDHSNGVPYDVSGFTAWIDGYRGDPGRTSLSSIVCFEDGSACGDSISERGDDYLAIAAATGGIQWNIGTSNWDEALEQLGMEAAGIRREFFLTQVPAEDTIEVEVRIEGEEPIFFEQVDEATLEADWGPEGEPAEFIYDRSRNSVRFVNLLPPPLAEVVITYEELAATPISTDDDSDLDSGEGADER